jgi:hypothetical protein
MSQNDYNVANQTFPQFRSDLNSQLDAAVTQNSGATEPTTTFSYMNWADTTDSVMKRRNSGDSSWIITDTLDSDRVLAKTADYTVLVGDYGKSISVSAASADVTITLPTVASAGDGYFVDFKRSDSSDEFTVLIDGSGVETIDGETSITLGNQYASAKLVCNGTSWEIVGDYRLRGGWEHISTQTASASASIDITNLLTQYSVIKIFVYNARPSTDGSNFRIRFSDDNGSTFASADYQYVVRQISSNAGSETTSSSTSGGSGLLTGGGNMGNGSQQHGSFEVTLIQPNDSTGRAKYNASGSYIDTTNVVRTAVSGGALFGTTSEIDAVQFTMNSGNIAEGQFFTYGLVKRYI